MQRDYATNQHSRVTITEAPSTYTVVTKLSADRHARYSEQWPQTSISATPPKPERNSTRRSSWSRTPPTRQSMPQVWSSAHDSPPPAEKRKLAASRTTPNGCARGLDARAAPSPKATQHWSLSAHDRRSSSLGARRA